MTKDGDAERSFDPRTWSGTGTGAQGGKKDVDGKDALPKQNPAPGSSQGGTGATSFDPRSWTTPPSNESASPADAGSPASKRSDAGSFDPRSWAGAPAAPDAAPETPSSPPKATPAGPQRPPTLRAASTPADRKDRIAALLAAAAILGSGAAGAWITRTPPQAATPSGPVPIASATSEAGGESSRTLQVAGPGEIAAALLTAGVDPAQAQVAAAGASAALGSDPGELRLMFTLATGPEGTRLTRLEATRSDGSGVRLTASAEGPFKAEAITSETTTRLQVVSGEMDTSSFYNAAVTAGVIDSLVSDFAAAFSFDFDFQQEIEPGDVFEAGFEQSINAAGEPFGDPRLVYASLRTKTKTRQLYRFLPPGETEAGWFDANGRSIVRSLMRTPVDGARVTSKFGYRVHPVLGYTKLHGGTDFGAPTGTPIYAAGDGEIQVASMRGAAGNMVRINHDNGWATHYFHLNRFGEGITPGVRVKQGQIIGEVGTTGRSTGPHLHYEVIIDGNKVDPLSIDTGTGVTLSGPALQAFMAERDRIDLNRSQQSQ